MRLLSHCKSILSWLAHIPLHNVVSAMNQANDIHILLSLLGPLLLLLMSGMASVCTHLFIQLMKTKDSISGELYYFKLKDNLHTNTTVSLCLLILFCLLFGFSIGYNAIRSKGMKVAQLISSSIFLLSWLSLSYHDYVRSEKSFVFSIGALISAIGCVLVSSPIYINEELQRHRMVHLWPYVILGTVIGGQKIGWVIFNAELPYAQAIQADDGLTLVHVNVINNFWFNISSVGITLCFPIMLFIIQFYSGEVTLTNDFSAGYHDAEGSFYKVNRCASSISQLKNSISSGIVFNIFICIIALLSGSIFVPFFAELMLNDCCGEAQFRLTSHCLITSLCSLAFVLLFKNKVEFRRLLLILGSIVVALSNITLYFFFHTKIDELHFRFLGVLTISANCVGNCLVGYHLLSLQNIFKHSPPEYRSFMWYMSLNLLATFLIIFYLIIVVNLSYDWLFLVFSVFSICLILPSIYQSLE